ncbi:FMN-binding protein [Streptomyces olivochromogenes]|uniref:FMN-binding protein n=1 Tax=Streptomyces olivochromogenes TaxID=1963 RepID=UPI001F22754B|nr:FMN-binding protein [Streptomyces olivochromogenes]MCF3136568.1 FMN-binding protein [Streptomyces olivochromogenes]
MRRALPVLALTVAGLIPLWRYQPSEDSTTTTSTTLPTSTAEAAGTPAPSSGAPSGASARVVAGPTVTTRKGDVQVEVTLTGDRISAVRLLRQPNSPQTKGAVPTLVQETLDAQSADIDTVSGATITSEGYRKSLQAALDEAGV